MTATRSGKGYWLVASDGGIFAFGDAGVLRLDRRHEAEQADHRDDPVGHREGLPDGGHRRRHLLLRRRGILRFGGGHGPGQADLRHGADAVGQGYWMVGSDGKILNYGDAAALGSASALKSVAAMASTPSGPGYWAVGTDGSLAAFGDATDLGHPTGTLTKPIVGMAVLPPLHRRPQRRHRPNPSTAAPTRPPPGPAAPTAMPRQAVRLQALDGTIGTRPQVHAGPEPPVPGDVQAVARLQPVTRATPTTPRRSGRLAQVGNRLFVGGFIHGLLDPSANDGRTARARTSTTRSSTSSSSTPPPARWPPT